MINLIFNIHYQRFLELDLISNKDLPHFQYLWYFLVNSLNSVEMSKCGNLSIKILCNMRLNVYGIKGLSNITKEFELNIFRCSWIENKSGPSPYTKYDPGKIFTFKFSTILYILELKIF